jgi:hypothetical protein
VEGLRKNSLLKHVIEGNIGGKIEGTGSRGRSCKQVLGDIKVKKECRKLKEEALDLALLRSRFGRGYGPVLRQTAKCNGRTRSFFFLK